MDIKIIDKEFSVCKVEDITKVDFSSEFCFLGKTDEEISLVCDSESVPENVTECENGWRAFRVEGVLDFSLTGILAKIASVLAEEKIPIFAVSTFNTDYILIKNEFFEKAIDALSKQGYGIKKQGEAI